MMLLISMAIAGRLRRRVATELGAGSTSTSGGSWPLLVTIMLLGHWLEMRAIGQAQGALAALAELLPDEAERVTDGGHRDGAGRRAAAVGDVVLVRAGRPGSGRRRDRRRRGRARRVDGHRRVPAGAQGRRATGSSPAPWPPTPPSGSGSTRSGTTPPWPASSAWSTEAQASRSRAQALADRAAALLFYVAAAAGLVTFVVWSLLGEPDRGGRAHGHGAGHRLPPRPRPGHPAGHRHLDRRSPPGPGSWSRTGWPSSGCGPSTPSCSTRPAR